MSDYRIEAASKEEWAERAMRVEERIKELERELKEAEEREARLRSLIGRYIEHVGEQEGTDFLNQSYPFGIFGPRIMAGTPEHYAFDAAMHLSDDDKRELAQIGIEVHLEAARIAAEKGER